MVTTVRAPGQEYTFIYLIRELARWTAVICKGFLNSLHFLVVFVGSVYWLQIKADI